MPYVETYYDYEIHRECFRVSDSPGYTHSTDTILKNISISKVYRNYFTAVFSLDVIRNLGNSKVGIYDNEELLELVTFNEQTSKITDLSLKLAYEIQHNITAKFMGNDECLPSNSMIIPIYEDMPEGFIANMTFQYNSTDVTPGEINITDPIAGSQSLNVVLKNDSNQAILNDTISLLVKGIDNDTELSLTATTNSNGVASFNLGVLEYGIYEIKAQFDGDNLYRGVEETLKVFFGITTTAVASKIIAGQKPSIKVHAEDFTSSPVQQTVSLWYGD